MLTDENDTSDATNLPGGVNTSVDFSEISSGGERSSSGDMSGGERLTSDPTSMRPEPEREQVFRFYHWS